MEKSTKLTAQHLLPLASTVGKTNEEWAKTYKFRRDDDRAKNANTICKLLYQKHSGRLNAICEDFDFKELYDFFEEYVQHIYEVNDSVPLFCYYDHWRGWRSNPDEAAANLSLRAVIEACIALYEPMTFAKI